MPARTRIGLIVGVVALVLNVCVSGFVGFCGPLLSLIAGAVAGFLTAQGEKAASKSDGARAGAVGGGIAGGLMIIGQVLGGISTLAIAQFTGLKFPLGTIPSPAASPAAQMIYYLGGIGTSLCIGIIGAVLAALAGAAAGYVGTPDLSPVNMRT